MLRFFNWVFYPKQIWWTILKQEKFKTRDTATTTSPFYTRRHREHFNVHWWKVLWIIRIRSFKKLEKVIYTVHSNTVYPWFLSKTKTKLVILYRHSSRYLTSLVINYITYCRFLCFSLCPVRSTGDSLPESELLRKTQKEIQE